MREHDRLTIRAFAVVAVSALGAFIVRARGLDLHVARVTRRENCKSSFDDHAILLTNLTTDAVAVVLSVLQLALDKFGRFLGAHSLIH